MEPDTTTAPPGGNIGLPSAARTLGAIMRRSVVILATIVTALWTAAAVAWAQLIVDIGPDLRPVAHPDTPTWRPPAVIVDPGVTIDQAEAQAVVTRIVNDPRGWQRHLDQYTIRIVRAGTHGTEPMPGVIGRANRAKGTIAISDEAWTTLGALLAAEGGTLDDQRAWVVNHELGHLILNTGAHANACPTPGAPAPVMRRTTYGIGDCTLNVWPNP